MSKYTVGLIGFVLGFFVVLSAWIYQDSRTLEYPEILPLLVECETFVVATEGELQGTVYIGQVELCGHGGLDWSNVWGPIGTERPSRMEPSPETSSIQ